MTKLSDEVLIQRLEDLAKFSHPDTHRQAASRMRQLVAEKNRFVELYDAARREVTTLQLSSLKDHDHGE